MSYNTTISVTELAEHLGDRDWAIVDSRYTMADPGKSRKDYEAAHIQGAVYAHLDEDLANPMVKGVTGRHPLPSVEKISQVFSRLGIDSSVQVVAYDDAGGAIAAGRAWWLLGWLGHDAVAVLDGGWQAWLDAGLPVRHGIEHRDPRQFIPRLRNDLIVTSEEVDALRNNPQFRLLDARSSERFHGVNETIDPIPGHIPGAISAPYAGNLNPDGTFLDQKTLQERYERLIDSTPSDRVVFYCGSGVTATHSILSMVKAGFKQPRLYVGSYSQWITDPERPVEK